eukprot:Platyproteum_vivax@DN14098_c0_g1_i1.p1
MQLPEVAVSKKTLKLNCHDVLKFIAFCLMVADHAALLLSTEATFRMPGRIAAPLFFYIHGFSSSFKLTIKKKLLFWTVVSCALNFYVDLNLPPLTILANFLVSDLLLAIPHFQIWKSHV